MPTKKPAPKPLSADKLVKSLLALNETTESIAAALHVSNNSVRRWRDGQTTPHAAHYQRLANLRAKKPAKAPAAVALP